MAEFSRKYLLANAIGGNVLFFYFCRNVFPCPVLFASVVTMLSRFLAICAKHVNSVTFFVISFISSSSPSSNLRSVFFLNNCLVRSVSLQSLERSFAIYCIALRNDSNFLLAVRVLFVKRIYPFFFRFFPIESISSPSQVVSLGKKSDFFRSFCSPLLELSQLSLKIFGGVFLCHPMLLILYRLMIWEFNSSRFGDFFEIVLGSRKKQ